MRIRPVGANALLIEVDDPLTWHAELLRRRAAGDLRAVDLVPGARTVLLDGVPDPAALAEQLPRWRAADVAAPARGGMGGLSGCGGEPGGRTGEPALVPPAKLLVIDVCFDGPDLPEVADHWGCSPEAVVTRLGGIRFRVAFCGFAPGFGYLAGLPAELVVPRRAEPRLRVPAGSVGLADRYAGIYPTASPAGWQLVGRTEVTLFDPARDPPALLAPGTHVQLLAL